METDWVEPGSTVFKKNHHHVETDWVEPGSTVLKKNHVETEWLEGRPFLELGRREGSVNESWHTLRGQALIKYFLINLRVIIFLTHP